MKIIIAVLAIRAIINMFDKKGENNVERNDTVRRIIHPAEFEIR